MNSSLYGTRLYVNCDLLKKNINYFKNNFPCCDIMAVVKANAYGHGDLEISMQLKKAWHFVDLVWVFVFTFFYLV